MSPTLRQYERFNVFKAVQTTNGEMSLNSAATCTTEGQSLILIDPRAVHDEMAEMSDSQAQLLRSRYVKAIHPRRAVSSVMGSKGILRSVKDEEILWSPEQQSVATHEAWNNGK
eukprot:gene18478-24968_t